MHVRHLCQASRGKNSPQDALNIGVLLRCCLNSFRGLMDNVYRGLLNSRCCSAR